MPGPHEVTQASPTALGSGPQPPHSLALTSLQRRESEPAQRQLPSQPQADPGTLSRTAHPPQLFGSAAPSHTTASMPSHTQLPPPHEPHSVPGSPASERSPPHALRGIPLQSQASASVPSQMDCPDRSVPSQAHARPGCVGSTAQPPQALVREAPRQADSPFTHWITPPQPHASPTATAPQGSVTVVSEVTSTPPLSGSAPSSSVSSAVSRPVSVASAATSDPTSPAGFFFVLPPPQPTAASATRRSMSAKAEHLPHGAPFTDSLRPDSLANTSITNSAQALEICAKARPRDGRRLATPTEPKG